MANKVKEKPANPSKPGTKTAKVGRSPRSRTGARTKKASAFRVKPAKAVRWAPKSPASGRVTVKGLRKRLGVTQKVMARLVDISIRKVSALETGEQRPSASTRRCVEEISRLQEALAEVIDPDYITEWLDIPNDAFEGLKPIEVIDRGEIDRIWHMVFFLRSGVAS